MAVQFLKKIIESMDTTSYGVSRRLNVPVQSLDHAISKGRSISIETLARVRYLSRKSWNQIGKWIDEEFLPEEERRKIDDAPRTRRRRNRKPERE